MIQINLGQYREIARDRCVPVASSISTLPAVRNMVFSARHFHTTNTSFDPLGVLTDDEDDVAKEKTYEFDVSEKVKEFLNLEFLAKF
jgi:hypothetical protein